MTVPAITRDELRSALDDGSVTAVDALPPAPSVKPGSEDMPGWMLPLLGGLALLGLIAFLGARALAGTLGGRPLAAGHGGRISDALTEAWESVRLGR